jgi:hypothetical protein
VSGAANSYSRCQNCNEPAVTVMIMSKQVVEMSKQMNEMIKQMREKKHEDTIASAFKFILLCVCMAICMKIII